MPRTARAKPTWASILKATVGKSRYIINRKILLKVGIHLSHPPSQDCLESEVFDLLIAKKWALKYAVNAACTILRVGILPLRPC